MNIQYSWFNVLFLINLGYSFQDFCPLEYDAMIDFFFFSGVISTQWNAAVM